MSVSGQADRFQARQAGQNAEDICISMSGPVVLDNVDPLGERVSLVEALIQLTDLATPDNVVIQIVDLSSQGIERTNEPPLSVIIGTRQDEIWHGGPCRPGPSTLRPTKKPISSKNTKTTWSGQRPTACRQFSNRPCLSI